MATGRFISLKWKVVLIISIVLILLHSVMIGKIYHEAQGSFLLRNQEKQQSNLHIARTLITKSSTVMGQFAESILMFESIAGNASQITTHMAYILDRNWQNWQVTWGLENLLLYDMQGNLVQQWGEHKFASDTFNLKDHILEVLQREEPVHTVLCLKQCYANTTLPVIFGTDVFGVVSLNFSLSDSVIEYRQATNTDLAILSTLENDEHKGIWKHNLSALTNYQVNKPLVDYLTEQLPLRELIDENQHISYRGKEYSIQAHYLDKSSPYAPVLLIIEDISSIWQQFHDQLAATILSGIISLFITLGLIIALLHYSLHRIQVMAQTLPELAKRNYASVRDRLAGIKQVTLAQDEIGILQTAAYDLTDKLQSLEEEANNFTHQLQQQSELFKIERDFIQKLVETAPILIITQNSEGNIISINNEVLNLCHKDISDCIGKPFDSMFSFEDDAHRHKLISLRRVGGTEPVSFDSDLVTNTGERRIISWLHSNIMGDSETSVILSLGLDVTERRLSEENIVWMANHDQLTNLSNRRHFNEELSKILVYAERYEHKVALFYMDLDQFKIVNDTQGHQQGDLLLQNVSDVLLTVTRQTDLLSRVGGDEFTMIMSDCKKEDIERVALRINEVLGQLSFSGLKDNFRISCSIGVAIYPEHGLTPHELLAHADMAMYKAKSQGEGRFHLYSKDVDYHGMLTQRFEWKTRIEDALRHDCFYLDYQPIQNVATGEISHYECLVRMKTEAGKTVYPGDFIPVAEETGIISQLDQRVIELAISKHIEIVGLGCECRLAVNLSGRSMNDSAIQDKIHSQLAREGVVPEGIIFEVTETSAVSNFNTAKNFIKEVKALGCKFALDDFGVGFSSFFYLKNLPLDYIKIDGSFIRKIDKSHEDKIFVKALSEVAQALGKKTIAEFVENEEILEILKEYGINYAQGYHIGKPGQCIKSH